MAPLAMQLLRDKSRSTLIYLLFAMLIVVFVFTFNTSGSGGCQPGGTSGAFAEVHDSVVDQGLWRMGMEATPGNWRADQVGADSFIAQRIPFYGLKPFARTDQIKLFDAHRHPIDSPAFADSPALKYAGFTRPHTARDQVKEIHVMGDLVENLLVAHEARELGLAISDEAVNDRVLKDWFDEESGEFRREAFDGFLRAIGLSAGRYKEFVRNEMLREQMIELVASMVSVSDAEVEQLYRDLEEEARFEYVVVDPAQVAPLVPVTDADVAQAAKDAEAIKTYYEENKAQFNQEKEVQVRALLVNAPSQAAIDAAEGEEKAQLQKQRAEAQAKANDLRTKALAGTGPAAGNPYDQVKETFSQIVKDNSDSTENKADGGLYDTQMNKAHLSRVFGEAVASKAINLSKGELTEAIPTDKGFWVLFGEDVSPAVNKTLEQATPEIARALARQKKAPEYAKQVAEQLLAKAKANPKTELDELVRQWNEEHRPADATTTPGGPVQEPPPAAEPEQPAEEAEAGTEPEPAEEVEADQPPPTEEAQPTEGEEQPAEGEAQPAEGEAQPAEGEAQPAEGEEQPTEGEAQPAEAEQPTEEAQPAEPTEPAEPAEPAEPVNEPYDGMLRAVQSPPVSRLGRDRFPGEIWRAPRESDEALRDTDDETAFDAEDDAWTNVPGVGKNEALKRALFNLSEENPVAGQVFKSEDGKRFYVVRLAERKSPEAEGADARKTEIRRQLLARRQREAYRAWYAQLYEAELKDGDIEFSEAWQDIAEQAWNAYRTARARVASR